MGIVTSITNKVNSIINETVSELNAKADKLAGKPEVTFYNPKVEGNVCGKTLDWSKGYLLAWKENPIEMINKGLDGRFKIKALTSDKYAGRAPQIEICPLPKTLKECFPVSASTVDEDGNFVIDTYIRMAARRFRHILKIKLIDPNTQKAIDCNVELVDPKMEKLLK